MAVGISKIKINSDSRVYFSKDNPQLLSLEALEQRFTKDDSLFIVLAPDDGNVFSVRNLELLSDLTDASWKLPYVTRVDSITNFQHSYSEEDDLVVEAMLYPDAEITRAKALRIKQVTLKEDLLVNRLVSPQGNVTGVMITTNRSGNLIEVTPRIAEAVRSLVASMENKYPNVSFYLTGMVMIDQAFYEASLDDIVTLIPLMLFILHLILFWILRSVSAIIATSLIILTSVLTAMGMAGWLHIELNPTSVNSPTIILTLAVANSIHILVTYLHQCKAGKENITAIANSIRLNLRPIIITSVTTAIGFLSMNYSDAPPFRDLGNLVSIGIISSLFYALILLPAIMTFFPVHHSIKIHSLHEKFYSLVARWVIHYQKPLFWGSLALGCIIGTGVFSIKLNDDYIKFFDQRYDFRQATDFTSQNLTGFYALEYVIDSGQENGINDPQFMRLIDAFSQWYREQPNITHVKTLSDVVKRLNKNMNQERQAEYRVPDSQELIAQYLLLYELSLPFGFDFGNEIDISRSAVRITVLARDLKTSDILSLNQNAQQWLQQNQPHSYQSEGSGLAIVFSHISLRNIESMLVASFAALIMISLLLMLALRSYRIGLLSIVPNLLPALIAFGLWGHVVGEVGLVISVLAALTLGIVVDDTVHFLNKYLYGRRELQLSKEEGIIFAFSNVGHALLTTSVVLVAGFLVMSFSGFQINSDMGIIVSLTIAIAIVMDFLFLPTLLLKFDNNSTLKSRRNILASDDGDPR